VPGLGFFAQTLADNTASRATTTAAGLSFVRGFISADPPDDPVPGAEHGEMEYEITRTVWQHRHHGECVGPAGVTIRTYERRDAADVADVFYRSVREVALSDYAAEQVRAWVPGRWDAEQEHRRSGDGRLVLVAADGSGHVVAFIDLEPDGHIDRLFCAPEAVGRGVASRLYDAIETAARAQGLARLFTEASELARRFFERKGFTVLERQDKVLRGVPIHNYRMAKTLG
jgi:putative acetyltransferase